jgi:hypothetical protein
MGPFFLVSERNTIYRDHIGVYGKEVHAHIREFT